MHRAQEAKERNDRQEDNVPHLRKRGKIVNLGKRPMKNTWLESKKQKHNLCQKTSFERLRRKAKTKA